MSIKALHLINHLSRGGIETWLMEMMRNCSRSVIQFDVCQIAPDLKVGVYEEEFKELGGHIYRCPLRNNLFSFNRDLQQILREGNYNILHSHHYFASGYFLKIASSIPNLKLIAHMHPTVDYQTGQRKAFPRPLYRWLMKKWIYKYSDAILGASEATLDLTWGVRWRENPKIHFQPNGIDLSLFDVKVDTIQVRKELGLPDNSRIVLTVGRHVPHKKHEIIPEIAKVICEKYNNVFFVINGEGPLKNQLQEKIHEIGLTNRFRLVSGFSSLVPLWKSSDAFLFPSTQEGFGIVVIEAAAAGLPVVARRIPGVTEAATVCKNAFLLEPDSSVLEWIQGVQKALDIGRVDVQNYSEFAEEFKFTTQRSLKVLKEIYEKLFLL